MKFNDIIRTAMKESNMTQKQLSQSMGYKSGPSAISVPLSRSDIYVSTLVNMLGTLGYEVVVRKGKEEMVLTND